MTIFNNRQIYNNPATCSSAIAPELIFMIRRSDVPPPGEVNVWLDNETQPRCLCRQPVVGLVRQQEEHVGILP